MGDDILKKYIVVIMLCLVLCGCGCSKKKTTSKKVEESYIGNEDVSYTLSISCGEYTKDSKVTLNKDKSATYELYECNSDTLELTTGSGTYKVSGSNVTITGSYAETLNLSVKDEKTIEVNFGNIKQTLTK